MNNLKKLILKHRLNGLKREEISVKENIPFLKVKEVLKDIYKEYKTNKIENINTIRKLGLRNHVELESFILEKKENLTKKQIVKIYNISKNQIDKTLKKYNQCKKSNLNIKKERINYWIKELNLKNIEEFEDLLIKEYQYGLRINDISKKYLMHKYYINSIFNKKNVQSKSSFYRRETYKKLDNNNCILKDEDYKFPLNKKMSYFLGILISDGNISKTLQTVGITQCNENYLKLLKEYFGGNINGNNLIICSCEFVDFLINKFREYNFKPNKSKIIKFPKENISYPDLIRGMYDGDGCFYIRKNGIIESIYYSSSYDLVDGLFKFLKNELKLKTKSKISEYRKNSYKISLSQKDTIKLIKYLYKSVLENKTELYLERKYKKVIQYLT